MKSAHPSGPQLPTSLERVPRAVRVAWSQTLAHPVATSFCSALIVRVVAAVAIWGAGGYIFPDEEQYVTLGHLASLGHLSPSYESGYGESLFHEAASFMWPLTFLFKVFGSHALVASLWAALFGALTAAAVAVLVGRVLGRGWSSLVGLVVAFFPSQVLWSSVVLRESMVWAGLVGAALGVMFLAKANHWQSLIGGTALAGGSLLELAYLRSWTFVATAWAVGLALWLFRPARPAAARSLCVLLCIVVPVVPGLGLAGSSYVRHDSGNLGYERTVLAVGAKSAFVHPKAVPVTSSKPGTKTTKPSTTTPTSPTTTSTPVTVPSALANESLVVPTGFKNDLKALPTGLIAFALRPFPWQHGDGLSYDFAGLEELLYYPLYVLAAIGVIAYRRRREVIAFPLLVTVLVTGIAAEAEGNLGSAFRHRDQLFWAVAFFATLGTHHLYLWWQRRHTSSVQLSETDKDRQSPTVHASL